MSLSNGFARHGDKVKFFINKNSPNYVRSYSDKHWGERLSEDLVYRIYKPDRKDPGFTFSDDFNKEYYIDSSCFIYEHLHLINPESNLYYRKRDIIYIEGRTGMIVDICPTHNEALVLFDCGGTTKFPCSVRNSNVTMVKPIFDIDLSYLSTYLGSEELTFEAFRRVDESLYRL